MHPLHPLPLLLALLLSPLLPSSSTTAAAAAAAATSSSSPPAIYTPPAGSGYVYHGCFNETTGLANTTGARALAGGTSLVRPGNMTVALCLDFCRTGAGDSRGGSSGRFAFAGLEYARECWCAQSLSSLAAKLPDSACDLPCEGNTTEACGGNPKLTVYMASAAAAARVAWAASLVAVGAVSLILL
ncbi:744fc8dd-f54b-4b9a-82f1-7bee06973933 [Thermothielavioides terrestris]|uniref:744fc8dd-f54b-4b9a-82f1-7bee06973933 n=1 Tax=Thermothielavioides terrestris TaxID=2587410 RepID=A0A3S5CVT7_9PEZI|nr:744fc8dd-f54b-4b9a-82f1-7bee06973933 [Thermothielavioides terrestris]